MVARVLIVDDNPTNLKLACDILEMAGYEVGRAINVEDALVAINRVQFDLILMDIELPGTDGLTLTRMLKAGKTTKDIPVVALTAFAMKGDDQKAFQAGCEGYITKPINTRTFPRQVAEFLDRSKKT